MIRLADFEGVWQLTRTIADHVNGQPGELTGHARFTRDDEGLHYREEGLLRIGTLAPVQAMRDYLWRAEGGGIAVYFADGKPFHRIDFGAPEDTHLCAPDTYRVGYDFSGWPQWEARWAVTGPRKHYDSLSRYAPCEHLAPAAEVDEHSR